MTDSLGYRRKFAVIAPSTNTSVQPEFDAMAPRGVTNHFGRISIPNDPIKNDDDFATALQVIGFFGIIVTSVIQMRVVAQILRRGDQQGRRRV